MSIDQYLQGQIVVVTFELRVKATGVLTNDSTEKITVYRQDKSVATDAAPVNVSTGVYRQQVTTDQPGYWVAISKATAGVAGSGKYEFFVQPVPG